MDTEKELKDLFLMQQTYATLFSVYNKLQTESDKHFMPLSSRQYMTISAVLHLPEDKTTINNIARKSMTTKQNTTQLLTALYKKGKTTKINDSYFVVGRNHGTRKGLRTAVYINFLSLANTKLRI